MEVDRSPHITPLYHGTQIQQHHHHDESHESSPMLESQAQFQQPRYTHPGFSVKIYDGFDFGFDKAHEDNRSPARRLRAPKSVGDLQAQRSKGADEQQQWNGLHSPTPRHLPGSFDEAQFFMKRGDWKRRGIVFGGGSTEPAHESDEDCFDI